MARSRSTRNRTRWLAAAVVLAVALAAGGPYVYINLFQGDTPERLDAGTGRAAADTTAGGAGASGSPGGTWTVGSGSAAGYRVEEVLLGQNTEAVGRTTAVTGELTVSGSQVESGSFTVDLTQVSSDEDRRDDQFQGRIMDTATYPTATFELTEPIALESLPADGVNVSSSIPVTSADYNVPNPSIGPVTTEDNGEIEFLLALTRA